MFEAGAEVLWYHNGQRCYGTVVNTFGDEVVVARYDEDGEPSGELTGVNEIYLRDADDPDDPDPEDPTR
jgi:hypothetical protein